MIRHQIESPPYRIVVLEPRDGAYAVEVHQEITGRWKLVRGPFRRDALSEAVSLAGDLKEGLRTRV